MLARPASTGSAGRFAPPGKSSDGHEAQSLRSGATLLVNPETRPVTAESVSAKLEASFGELTQHERVRQAIASEVQNYMRMGRKTVSDADIAGLETRIRGVLSGHGPTRNTKVIYKRAIADADEWGRLFNFQDELAAQEEAERKKAAAEKHAGVHSFLMMQLQEEDLKRKKGQAEEAAQARLLEQQLKQWDAKEAAREAQRKNAMLRLRADVEGNLAERQAAKALEASLKLKEEQGTSAALAHELKHKMEAEAEAVAKAKEELKEFLAANEAHKAAKEQARLQEQAEERRYAREYADKLDREEKARAEQLAQMAARQSAQAAIAQHLPPTKRWIDPAIIDRNFKAREEAEERAEMQRRQNKSAATNVFKTELAQQIADRQAVMNKQKMEHKQEEVQLEASIKKEKDAEAAERERAKAKREALHQHLHAQLQEALTRKLQAEPAMTPTERQINADMLRKMHAAEAARNASATFAA